MRPRNNSARNGPASGPSSSSEGRSFPGRPDRAEPRRDSRPRLEKIAKGAEERLKVEFKELKNDQTLDTVMGNVQKALESAVLDVFEARAEKAKERLIGRAGEGA